MEDKELGSKTFTFYHLNTQLKSLGKLKDSLRDEIKEEMKLRKADLLDIGKCRINFSTYDKTYAKKEKINNFLIESGEKLDDYYEKRTHEKLQVVKKITKL